VCGALAGAACAGRDRATSLTSQPAEDVHVSPFTAARKQPATCQGLRRCDGGQRRTSSSRPLLSAWTKSGVEHAVVTTAAALLDVPLVRLTCVNTRSCTCYASKHRRATMFAPPSRRPMHPVERAQLRDTKIRSGDTSLPTQLAVLCIQPSSSAAARQCVTFASGAPIVITTRRLFRTAVPM
jgi:hypothetical protein